MGLNHIDFIVDEDPKCIIDVETRKISSDSPKNSIIQFDHNSERVGFKIKRHIDGHDMYESDRIVINYINGSSSGSYIVDDVTVGEEDDTISFTWLISGHSTKNVGSLVFAVTFRCFDDDGKITYNWSTQPCNIFSILSGVEESIQEEIPEEIYDEFAKLEGLMLSHVDNKVDSKISNIIGNFDKLFVKNDLIVNLSSFKNQTTGEYKNIGRYYYNNTDKIVGISNDSNYACVPVELKAGVYSVQNIHPYYSFYILNNTATRFGTAEKSSISTTFELPIDTTLYVSIKVNTTATGYETVAIARGDTIPENISTLGLSYFDSVVLENVRNLREQCAIFDITSNKAVYVLVDELPDESSRNENVIYIVRG